MVFSDTSTKLGILQACERYCNTGDAGITGSTVLKAEFTAHINSIMRRVWPTIFLASGSWEYDDSNQTDLPIAVTNLVNGQSIYSIPIADMTIKRLEVKDQSGIWHVVQPIILNEIKNAVDEHYKVDALPREYRAVGSTIELFPGSNYDSTAGLKIYFDRGSVSFASSDTTKTPGFASEFHDIIAIGASLEYKKIKTPGDGSLTWLAADYEKIKVDLQKYYSRRLKDKSIVARPRYSTFK